MAKLCLSTLPVSLYLFPPRKTTTHRKQNKTLFHLCVRLWRVVRFLLLLLLLSARKLPRHASSSLMPSILLKLFLKDESFLSAFALCPLDLASACPPPPTTLFFNVCICFHAERIVINDCMAFRHSLVRFQIYKYA